MGLPLRWLWRPWGILRALAPAFFFHFFGGAKNSLKTSADPVRQYLDFCTSLPAFTFLHFLFCTSLPALTFLHFPFCTYSCISLPALPFLHLLSCTLSWSGVPPGVKFPPEGWSFRDLPHEGGSFPGVGSRKEVSIFLKLILYYPTYPTLASTPLPRDARGNPIL